MSPIAECLKCRVQSPDVSQGKAEDWAKDHHLKEDKGRKVLEQTHTRFRIVGGKGGPYGFSPHVGGLWIYPGHPDAEKFGL